MPALRLPIPAEPLVAVLILPCKPSLAPMLRYGNKVLQRRSTVCSSAPVHGLPRHPHRPKLLGVLRVAPGPVPVCVGKPSTAV